MAKRPLGSLNSVDLREAWSHEAHDFTPWLAKNLHHLATAIGIEQLEREGTEVPLPSAPLRADIVARNPQDDSRVLIENQLERADLHHLGQVLAYLAGLEAKTVIWVAKDFDEAHLSALRWLNEHTGESFGFFAVRVRVVRIGDSPLAPQFEVLERPNDWDRQVHETVEQSRELGKLGQFRRDFWAHVAKRHPDEVPPGWAGSNVRHRSEGADRYFSKYIAQNGVGLFFPRERGESNEERAAAVASCVDWLRQETKAAEMPDNGSSFLEIDSHDHNNWDRMADWLHDQRLLYERALSEVGQTQTGGAWR